MYSDENIVVFPSGNWITNKVYYNSSKEEFRQLDLDSSIDMTYIDKNNQSKEKITQEEINRLLVGLPLEGEEEC